MICCIRCSSSALAALTLLASSCAGPRTKPPRAIAGPILVLPPANLAGEAVPLKDIRFAVESALTARSIPIVPGAEADAFLSRHRIRWTGGVDRAATRAAATELGAAAVLVTQIESDGEGEPPRFAIGVRLVSTGPAPEIVWMDQLARTGDDSPGLFDLGLVTDPKRLRAQVLAQVADGIRGALDGRLSVRACSRGYPPASWYRSPKLGAPDGWSVVVLPFDNQTRRRGAGDLLALEFVRQLVASPGVRVVEPGVVRADLNEYRITLDEGISLDVARVILELVDADYVLAGTVRDFVEPASGTGVPVVQFSAMLLDRRNSEVVWEASSAHHGDEKVVFFDIGHVATAPMLACRMASSALADLLEGANPAAGTQKMRPPPESPKEARARNPAQRLQQPAAEDTAP